VRIRLTPDDDFLHPLEEASNFNESRYYNFFDGSTGLGGWLRLGNRPNEGYAEMTTCLYLPSGSVAFMFGRPKIEGHTAHDAGGLRFEVLEPFAHHRLSYRGQVLLLDQPQQMEDPSTAFKNNPRVDCQIDLDIRSIARPWGGEPEGARPEDPEKSFARGHTEQHIASTGPVTVGDDRFEVGPAFGLCDHSWGPRYWQAVWWYRWLTVNLGPGLGFATTVTGTEAGEISAHGFLYDVYRYGNDQWVPIRDVKLASDYQQDYHRSLQVAVTTDDHVYDVEGTVWSRIPLRNRRHGLVTRITEGMTTWKCGELTGAGLSEYLDQIVDGRPVGMAAGM
jgi:hypothetical protein